MKARKHLLIVSHFFPPMGGGGVQRVSKFVKYLDRLGWRASIVCGQPQDYWMRDESLLGELPQSARRLPVSGASGLGILRRLRPASTRSSVRSASGFSALRRLSAWMLIPDSYIGWRRFALRQARAVLRQDPPLAILSTGPPETNHLVARELQRQTGLPWVADFRDPWFALHLHPAPTAWHRWRHAMLERQVLTHASAVLATTRWLADLLQVQGGGAVPVHLIRNGFDPEDFSSAPAAAEATAPLRLVHTGMLTLTRSANGLLHGLHHLRRQHPEFADAFRIELIGARESDNDALIHSLGLQDCVEVRDYVPHEEAILAMQGADVLLLIKHTEERFRGLIPGKLYEYMGARRPILALVPESEAATIIQQSGCGEVVPPGDADAIGRCLVHLLQKKRQGTLQSAYSGGDLQEFDRGQQTRVLAGILDRLVDGSPQEAT